MAALKVYQAIRVSDKTVGALTTAKIDPLLAVTETVENADDHLVAVACKSGLYIEFSVYGSA
jgi:hypothetical protein